MRIRKAIVFLFSNFFGVLIGGTVAIVLLLSLQAVTIQLVREVYRLYVQR